VNPVTGEEPEDFEGNYTKEVGAEINHV